MLLIFAANGTPQITVIKFFFEEMLNLKKNSNSNNKVNQFVKNVWRRKFKRIQMQQWKNNSTNANVKAKVFDRNNYFRYQEE